ncbi:MAG: sigma-70 family RNA polymerase sigma factor [Ilumatobacteraceae bacterium]
MGSADMLRSAANGVLPDRCDAVLIDRVRDGDRDAFAMLYERHRPAARRFARSLVRTDSDADDVVAEVFARVLMAMERGKGPVGTFAPYVMRSVRNECYRVNRRGRRESADRFESVDGDQCSSTSRDQYERFDEVAVLRVALESLPAHQRELLWHTEVDEVTPTELADRNGSTPHAVAMMAMRARRALGSAYLDQHLIADRVHDDLDAECRDARPHLVGFVRGTLGVRRRRHVEAHLARCARCDEAREGLGRVNRQLRVLPIMPLDAGAVGATSLGIKAQILGWLSAQAGPVAASGMLAVSVLGGPAIHRQPPGLAADAEASTPAPLPADLDGPAMTVGLDDQQLLVDVAGAAGPDVGPTDRAAAPLVPTVLAERPATTTPPPGEALPGPSTSTVLPMPDPDSHPGTARATTTPAPANPAGVVGAGRALAAAQAAEPDGPPPGQVTDNGSVNASGVGAPPGQVTNNGNSYGNAGTPPGQVTDHSDGNAGTPPGHVTNDGNADGNGSAGTPPGQLTNNANGNTGTPPAQAVDHANANGNAGAPPDQVTIDGGAEATSAATE